MERKQMIVDVLVLLLWKTAMVMIDLATAVQTTATSTAASIVVVEVMINCPSFLMKTTMQKIDCLSFLMKTTTKANP